MFDGYIICGTPRTGSTLLCKLLASTGTSGDPHSFYRRQDISEWADEWKLPARDTMGELEFNVAYLDAAITELSTTLLANSPVAMRATKHLLHRQEIERLSRNLRAAVNTNAELRVTDDFREGIAAFLEKRKPVWPSRC